MKLEVHYRICAPHFQVQPFNLMLEAQTSL
jgi:hypothetical protein